MLEVLPSEIDVMDLDEEFEDGYYNKIEEDDAAFKIQPLAGDNMAPKPALKRKRDEDGCQPGVMKAKITCPLGRGGSSHLDGT
jgi:hypothetical protein